MRQKVPNSFVTLSLGDDMKKFLLFAFVAILVGGGFALYIFKDQVVATDTKETTVSAFQIGVYKNYDNAYKVAVRNNGIVIKEENLYRVYVAIVNKRDSISLLSTYYDSIGLSFYLKEILVEKDFLDYMNRYEEILANTSSDQYNEINLNILNKYLEIYE